MACALHQEVGMKPLSFGLALVAAVFALSGGTRIAEAQQCGGEFRQCAIAVGGFCTYDRGGQVINYWDYSGNVMMFERCVGGIFEANGLPDPYKTGVTSVGNRRGKTLTVPRSELLYPSHDFPRGR
jgi:hypothetical protein